MGRRLLPTTLSRWVDLRAPGYEVLSVREGLTETAVLLRRSRWGTPVSYQLLTYAISMAGLNSFSGRYMADRDYRAAERLFAHVQMRAACAPAPASTSRP